MINPWIDIAKPAREINVRLVSDKHPLMLYWGKDVKGAYLFIIEFSSDAAPDKSGIPDLRGLRVINIPGNPNNRLALLLNETPNWEIFKSLCIDLISASEQATCDAEAVHIILQRLFRWHDFLKLDHKQIMNTTKIKGLIGELLFMKNVLAPNFDWDEAISFWKGPLGAPQDFVVHDTAIEIKVQSATARPHIEINSLEQLETQLPDFYIIVNTLSTIEPEHEDAFTLNSLVDNIYSMMLEADENTKDMFEALLLQAGYRKLDEYDTPSYRCVTSRSFYVGDNFPRLTVKSVPAGIVKASYHISIDCLETFEQEIHF